MFCQPRDRALRWAVQRMRTVSTPSGGAVSRRFSAYRGIYFDEFAPDSAWIRENGRLHLPPLAATRGLLLRGEVRPHPAARGRETG